MSDKSQTDIGESETLSFPSILQRIRRARARKEAGGFVKRVRLQVDVGIEQTPLSEQVYSEIYPDGLNATQRLLVLQGATPSDAEEIAQGAWVRAWMDRARLCDVTRVQAWVDAIALTRFHRRGAGSGVTTKLRRLEQRIRSSALVPGVENALLDQALMNEYLDVGRLADEIRAIERKNGQVLLPMHAQLGRAKAIVLGFKRQRAAQRARSDRGGIEGVAESDKAGPPDAA